MSTPLGMFRIFSQIRDDILEWMFITGVNDTGDKLFTGVKNTADKFMLTPAINPCHGFLVIAGVIDTGEKFITGDNHAGD